MRIKTHFPLDLPHIPMMPHHVRDKLIHKTLKGQIGKAVSIEIDGESFEAIIVEIRQVDGGFDTTVEYDETS
jgi:hypothetical protein